MQRIVKQSKTEYYEFTEKELREALGLPDDFRILVVMGTGPFQVYRMQP